MNGDDRFPTDPAAPDRPELVAKATVHALPRLDDPRLAETRDILLGASTMGFVGVVILGVQPRGTGTTVIGSSDLDALRMLGTLELAKDSVIRRMGRGPDLVPPGAAPRKEP